MKKILTLILACSTLTMFGQVVDENFNSSDAGWVGSSDSGNPYWEWGAPVGTIINDDNSGGGNAWVTGLTGDFSIQDFEVMYLTSGTYDLSSLSTTGSVSLAINHDLGNFDMSFGPVNDIALLEYTIDGLDWFPLGEGTTGTNWYDDAEGGWVGSSGGWIVASHDRWMH